MTHFDPLRPTFFSLEFSLLTLVPLSSAIAVGYYRSEAPIIIFFGGVDSISRVDDLFFFSSSLCRRTKVDDLLQNFLPPIVVTVK
jgi:hypothetical protein